MYWEHLQDPAGRLYSRPGRYARGLDAGLDIELHRPGCARSQLSSCIACASATRRSQITLCCAVSPCYCDLPKIADGCQRPGPEAGVLLCAFDFANANKVFCYNMVTFGQANKNQPSPFSEFLSLTSYMFQHAHRSTRAASYTYLNLFVLQILVEDQSLCKRLCSDETKLSVRLCRQRQPYLPIVRGERVPAAIILDMMSDGISHNLRRRLDVDFYV